jgi:enoyl-CoA hydratase/carnithine racemase
MPVRVEQDAGILTLTLSNPGRKNALSTAIFKELLTALNRGAVDDTIRVVVLCGAEGDFSSGADLSESRAGRGHWLPYMRWVAQVATALHDLPKPTIAKVTGVAVGAGANMALGCDLVVADQGAMFCEIFVHRGLTPDFGGSYLLPRLVGMHRAKELAFLGERLSGAQAADIGLINRAVPADELDEFVSGWAAKLAAAPPLSLGLTKKLLNASPGSSLAQVLEAESVAQALNFTTRDTKEAIAAYRERRQGDYEMR